MNKLHNGLDLALLFAIAIMPFCAVSHGEYLIWLLPTTVIFYTGNIFLLPVCFLPLWLHLSNEKNHFTNGLSEKVARLFIVRSVVPPMIFIITVFAYLYIPKFSPVFLVIIALAFRIGEKIFGKKYYPAA